MLKLGMTMWVGALALLLCLPQGARAAEPETKRVKVLGMQVEGSDLSAKDREDLFKVVQAKLRAYPTVDLLKPPEGELMDIMIQLECIDLDLDCLNKLGKKYGAEQVFYTQVDKGKSGTFVLLVRVVDVAKGEFVRDKKVPVSKVAGLANALEKQVEKVFGEPPKKVKTGVLELKVEPPGSRIFIDKKFVGAGYVKLDKEPGKYVVRVERKGYEEQVLELEVKTGETTASFVELKEAKVPENGDPPKKEEPPGEPKEFYEEWWFWTAVGVVVLGATIGIAVGASGEDEKPTGSVVFSVDPQNAWRDSTVQGGTP